MLQKATLIGKQETFRSWGIETNREIELETLIASLKKQLEQEYYDTESVPRLQTSYFNQKKGYAL